MNHENDRRLAKSEWPDLVQRVRERTPARLLQGRAGASYRTATQIELREAHAAARDAIRAELNTEADLGADLVRAWHLFDAYTEARDKDQYLLRPSLGRLFCEASRQAIAERCCKGSDLQIVIGDGLSVAAVSSQVPALLPLLKQGAQDRGLSIGRAFVVHHCRVGILNEIGELLDPAVAVLLIGERPGLATAESLSAYMAYRPRRHHSDANRNLVSNIHSRGVNSAKAAKGILNLAAQMMRGKVSGYTLRENMTSLADE